MELISRVKELIVEKTNDTWTISIDGRIYEATVGVSINVVDLIGDVHLFGLDNPSKFELYEGVKKLQLEREDDGSIYIEIYILGY